MIYNLYLKNSSIGIMEAFIRLINVCKRKNTEANNERTMYFLIYGTFERN